MMMSRTGARRVILMIVGVAAVSTIGALPAGAGRAPLAPGLIVSAPVNSRLVALTFDDGPSPYTPQILAILRRFHVSATFMIYGLHVTQYPAYLQDEVRDGEEIGNHTFNHPDLQLLSTPEVIAQLQENQATIHAVAGVTPHWFRPPYGDVDMRIIDIAASLGLRTITWSVDPADWEMPGVQSIISNVVSNVQPGSVVLLHDGGGDRSQTVAALPTIIRTLRARGYRFATLDELFGFEPVPACVPNARRRFAAAGFPPLPHDPIFRSWSAHLCAGTDLGPATSRQLQLTTAIVARDFRQTGHRIEFNRRSGRSQLRIVWPWVIGAFEAHGIRPRFGDPITRAWFGFYLNGRSWGAALTEETAATLAHCAGRRRARLPNSCRVTVQRFARGWAVERAGGAVGWLAKLRQKLRT